MIFLYQIMDKIAPNNQQYYLEIMIAFHPNYVANISQQLDYNQCHLESDAKFEQSARFKL